ncbi:MAG: phenylalanine--tRNA ligase subunit beta [Arcobacter sp.]|uniref:phenylalanine--tRNA ligase subunit beta n=1 Tax=Arcobacter sp. TaxID=1872629 RepID=UPI003C736A30
MIVTKRWLEDFIDISKIDINDICKKLNSIGLEVDSLEKVRIPSGVVIGYVESKEKHPDADKLSVCQVNIGSEVTQIVCGAKNVAAGQYVPVATVGCVLGADFKIKKAKLRGLESNGMICSSTEIGLPKLNDGILELDDSIGELVIGKELNEYRLINDDIIEIELTANRGDCLSIHGVARELSVCYGVTLCEQEKNLEYNDIGIGQLLEIESDSTISSSLIYKAGDFTELKVPILYKLRVATIDLYKECDIENILSYATHATGVTMHAYAKADCDTLNDLSVLHIKKSKDGFDEVYGKEKLSTISIKNEAINKDDTTYILEASYNNPEELSKNVFDKKIKTGEVYYKTSRGSEPNIESGMEYFTTLISKFGAKLYRGYEVFTEDKERLSIDVSIKRVSSIVGKTFTKVKIEKILSGLGFTVKDGGSGVLSVQVPLFRHDIKNIADITEEIVRIVGIDNIESTPLQIEEVNRLNEASSKITKKNKVRAKAIENGFFETLTYVFTRKETLEKYNLETVDEKLDILNPIVNELNTFRTTILTNLIEACSNNFKQGFKKVAFFEIGTVFDNQRKESQKISFIFSGDSEYESFTNNGKPVSIEFFGFAKKVANTIGKFDLEPMNEINNLLVHPYQNANIIVDNKKIGFISKLHPNVAKDYDLPDTFIAEIDFDKIANNLIKVNEYSKFQASKRDLSLIVPKDISYSKIRNVINSIEDDTIQQFNLVDTYSDEKLGDKESLTIRFVLQSFDKTLEEDDINATMNSILEKLNSALGIGIR